MPLRLGDISGIVPQHTYIGFADNCAISGAAGTNLRTLAPPGTSEKALHSESQPAKRLGLPGQRGILRGTLVSPLDCRRLTDSAGPAEWPPLAELRFPLIRCPAATGFCSAPADSLGASQRGV